MSEFKGLGVSIFLRDSDVDDAEVYVNPGRADMAPFPVVRLGDVTVMASQSSDLAVMLRRLADRVEQVTVTEAMPTAA